MNANHRSSCPVCATGTSPIRDRDYGDKLIVDCPRCGAFEISGTAVAMLTSRLETDNLAFARLSHSIRTGASANSRFVVNSTNLDELLNNPLPSISQQISLLVKWISSQLRDDHFGEVSVLSLNSLSGVVGVVDEARVDRLIDYATQEKYIEHRTELPDYDLVDEGKIFESSFRTILMLAPKGRVLIDSGNEVPERAQKPSVQQQTKPSTDPDKRIKSHCNHCGPARNAYVRSEFNTFGNDEETSWSDTYQILECCGCGELSVKQEHWFSEWDWIDEHPITGQPRLNPGIKVSYWPPITTRKKPDWIDMIEAEDLRKLLDEVYQALNSGLLVLASVGTRTVLDRAMFLRVGDPPRGFTGKLDTMESSGFIGREERHTLEIMTDAGSASAHRGFSPSPKILDTIVNTMENFIHREFILKTAAGEVRKLTPRRNQSDG